MEAVPQDDGPEKEVVMVMVRTRSPGVSLMAAEKMGENDVRGRVRRRCEVGRAHQDLQRHRRLLGGSGISILECSE